MKQTPVLWIAAAALVACSGKEAPVANTASQVAAPNAAATASPLPQVVTNSAAPVAAQQAAAPAVNAAPPASNKLSGKVAETLDAGGYTYIRLKTADAEHWIAVPKASVKKGSTVTVDAQMVAEKFESKTLNRTFDKLVFATLSGGGQGAAPAANVAPASMMSGSAAQHMAAPGNIGDVKVEKAANGKTVAEVWGQKESLKDQPVVIRGKVVKFLAGIMGKNWLHLRDGSGAADKGDNDIAVTTLENVTVGDVVTVTGTLRVDKDFGAGYRYPVIVEDAKLSK